ncbi:zinc finger C3H1 domain-containing protein-like isoform X2 [Patiria miniata]|uniref:Putative zinc-finger domain-containing protein n=1 Tax=Patiria miniata TaxID=46514 RepID=A0A913ZGN6_PATMI|nr:zinc finger C3H1 domain-containing protein-like isoform X2 [Patiria miniata]
MSGNDVSPQSQTMETTEKSELEDGEIEDETGSENDQFVFTPGPGSSRKFQIPSLMTMNVAQKGWQRRGEPPTSRAPNRYFPRNSGSHQRPQGRKYPASTVMAVGGPQMLEPLRKRSMGSREFTGGVQNESSGAGVKRRREMNKDDVIDERRLPRNDKNLVSSAKKTRQFDRKRARRRSRTKVSLEKESNVSSDQDEYEALLRKHHEVQELIKQEEQKLTSERRSLDSNQEEGGGDENVQLDSRGKGPESSKRLKTRSRSRSGSLKKDLASPQDTTVEDGSDAEIVEVGSPAVEDIIEIPDDDDEDDDELLQLRRLALESATKNVAAREEKENQAQKHKAEKTSEYKQAKQRERRQKVKQLFHKQSIAAEIFKVHGEKERFDKFMEIIASRRGSLSSSQGKSVRRSPSVGKESSKKHSVSSSEDLPAEFQYDNYEQVEMDVSEMEESPTLTPVTESVGLTPDMGLTPDIMQVLTSSDTDTSTAVESITQGNEDAVAEGNKDNEADSDDADDDDDDDDVMALREQLLRSLATKRAAKAQAQEKTEVQEEEYTPDEPSVLGPTYEPSPILTPSFSKSSPSSDVPPLATSSPKVYASPISTPRTQSPTSNLNKGLMKAKTKPKGVLPPIPTHKPVVIQFDGDSDSSDDEHSPQKPEMKQINFLDQFLKEARRTADAKKSQSQQPPPHMLVPKTPDAMHKLPEIHRAEYHKLKEEIARREQQKLSKSASFSGLSSGTQSPVRDVTISITKVDGKVQRTVVLKDPKAKDTADLRQDGEKVQVGKKEVPPGTTKESPEVLACQGSLTKHRLTAEKDCRILSALEKQIQKRHLILRQTEAKLQQLREELSVGERIAASNRSQIKKYIQQKHLIQRKVQEHVTLDSQLRENLAKAKGVAVTNISQSQMMLQAASRLPKKTAVIGGRLKSKGEPNSPMSKTSETQLQRLQRLEREYANQITKLREENAKQAARQTNPVPKTVVRILKTKTKLLNKKPSQQLLTKDKIVLGKDTPTNTDSESDAEKYLRSRKDSKRRRSFLDNNPSLKPNLHATSQINQSELSKSNVNQSTSSTSIIDQSASSKPAINQNKPTVSADPLKPADGNKSSASGKAPFKADSRKTSPVTNKSPNKSPSIADGMSIPSEEQVERLRCAHAEKSKTALDAALLAIHFPLESDATSGSNNYFSRKTAEVKMSIVEDAERMDQDEDVEQSLVPYSSPLLCFRSYRLSPFFVQEAKLSRLSLSFSHKLNPMRAMCQFELNGTCNDDECPWQHKKDYEMTDHEVYADLLAYTSLIATSKDWQDPEKRHQRVEDYINKAVKKSKRPENAKRQREALCRAFANAVLTQTKKVSPGIIAQPRSWTPKQAPSTSPQTSGDKTDPPLLPRGSKMTEGLQIIPLGGGNQERYFSGEGIADLEAAVLETPGDVKMWIKLACRIIGDESEDQDIDPGLNALSRGLEANQSSSELWLQYLLLYSQREDHSDLSELCQQALQFAPSYDLYWQCLSFEESFPAKDAICDRMITFLQSQQMKAMTSQGSHQLLEALLYRVQLHIMTRRVKQALSMLQGALKGSQTSSQYLTPADHCLMWLVHIHMIEYQRLPPHLFDPTSSGLGHIVSKEPLVFQWGSSSAIQSAEGVRAAFQEALSACSPDKSGLGLSVCMPLYQNWVVLEQLTGRHEKAEEICQRLITEFPANPEPWLLLIDVHKHQGSNRTKIEQVLKMAVKRRCAAIHNAVAKFAMQNNPKASISVIKFCVNTFFTIPDKSAYESVEQIRRLYCSLLGLSLPFDYSPPDLRPGVSSEVVEEQSQHLWLNYCLLQELTAEDSVACDAYEQSLCHLKRTEDVQRLWIEYLLFRKSKLAASQDKSEAFRAFTGLVNRCLVSMATEFPLPHSDKKTWLDFSFHNRVVELYIECLKDDDRLDMYERFIDRMPNNINLAFRACHYASKSLQSTNYLHRVKAIATDVLNKFPECLPFWKIMIALSLHRGRLKEAKMLYQLALEAVPLAANLWKDFFLLEVVHDQNPEDIRKLVLKCRELKVNIEDYLKTILK